MQNIYIDRKISFVSCWLLDAKMDIVVILVFDSRESERSQHGENVCLVLQ